MDNNRQQSTKMDKNGQKWTAMDTNRQQLITMDNNGQKWTIMDKNGQQWTTMDNNRLQWTTMEKMDNNGSQWITMDKHGQNWTTMDKNGQQSEVLNASLMPFFYANLNGSPLIFIALFPSHNLVLLLSLVTLGCTYEICLIVFDVMQIHPFRRSSVVVEVPLSFSFLVAHVVPGFE